MNQDVLVVFFQLVNQFKDACFVFQVFFLLYKEIVLAACTWHGCSAHSVFILTNLFSRINSMTLQHHMCFSLRMLNILSKWLLLGYKLKFQILNYLILLLNLTFEHFLFNLDLIQFNNKWGVFIILLFYFNFVSFFLFNGTDFEWCDWSLHVSKFSIKLLNVFDILLFAGLSICSFWHHIVLV